MNVVVGDITRLQEDAIVNEACDIAVSATRSWLSCHDLPERVTFCCFNDSGAEVYRARLALS